jgi:hypothetical protein
MDLVSRVKWLPNSSSHLRVVPVNSDSGGYYSVYKREYMRDEETTNHSSRYPSPNQFGNQPQNQHPNVQSNGTKGTASPLNPFASNSLLAATLLGTRIPQQSPNNPCSCPPSSISSLSPPPLPNPSGGAIILPNKKCCITVRFPRTSPLNIFPMPSRTFVQVFTPEMSSNMGECQRNPTVLTELIWDIQPRYMYCWEKNSSVSETWIDLGRMCGWWRS